MGSPWTSFQPLRAFTQQVLLFLHALKFQCKKVTGPQPSWWFSMWDFARSSMHAWVFSKYSSFHSQAKNRHHLPCDFMKSWQIKWKTKTKKTIKNDLSNTTCGEMKVPNAGEQKAILDQGLAFDYREKPNTTWKRKTEFNWRQKAMDNWRRGVFLHGGQLTMKIAALIAAV